MIITHIKPNRRLRLRILATIIDMTIWSIIFWVYITVYTTYIASPRADGGYDMSWRFVLSIILGWIIYFPLTEAANGATPGHDMLKLKVIKDDGGKVTFADALKRRACDPLDICLWGMPALVLIAKTPKHQRIGDIVAGTRVVKKSDIILEEVNFR